MEQAETSSATSRGSKRDRRGAVNTGRGSKRERGGAVDMVRGSKREWGGTVDRGRGSKREVVDEACRSGDAAAHDGSESR